MNNQPTNYRLAQHARIDLYRDAARRMYPDVEFDKIVAYRDTVYSNIELSFSVPLRAPEGFIYIVVLTRNGQHMCLTVPKLNDPDLEPMS